MDHPTFLENLSRQLTLHREYKTKGCYRMRMSVAPPPWRIICGVFFLKNCKCRKSNNFDLTFTGKFNNFVKNWEIQ